MIELRHLSKTFNPGTPSEHLAIDDLSLSLESGDFVTIIGGNGAGKSTMLSLIAGSLSADGGEILLNNNDISRLSEHRRAPYFGRVFQDPLMGTAADMTVLENLALAYNRGHHHSPFRWSIRAKDKAYFKERLSSLGLGLENRMGQKVGLLSGGQRQALTLLMAVIRQPPSHQRILKDYVRFYDGDKKAAKEEVRKAYAEGKAKYRAECAKINADPALSPEEKQKRRREAYRRFDEAFRAYDVTKPVLMLDEHTAALDPQTAAKVLEITERFVRANALTTLMVTHNMKDAIRYGDRLIMMSKGKVVVDVRGPEKSKLTIEQLMALFAKASSDDALSDSTILGD